MGAEFAENVTGQRGEGSGHWLNAEKGWPSALQVEDGRCAKGECRGRQQWLWATCRRCGRWNEMQRWPLAVVEGACQQQQGEDSRSAAGERWPVFRFTGDWKGRGRK